MSNGDSEPGYLFARSTSVVGRRALVGEINFGPTTNHPGSAWLYTLNQSPTVRADAFTVIQDQTLSGNVLQNNGQGPDFDPDGDPLEILFPGSFGAALIGGQVTLSADGNFAYTPPPGVIGEARFNYAVTDPFGGFSAGTVTIIVRSNIFNDRFESLVGD
jgi:hypothetical protein